MLRITRTENGMVQGTPGTDARITVYKGIPFAAPPVGENRWRAPQPVQNWEGVRICNTFGPITMQKTPGSNAFYGREWHVDPEIPMSEDGLYLNIWTPAKKADEKLPVMVWIFGGGMQEGYAHEMEFDGERFASRGVILVSIAYRLNAFGLLAHPDLRKEDPERGGNFTLLDQQYALQWVQRNIANFGGDPGNVTIFGQSAGGDCMLYHLCSPMSKGLFHRVIIQSAGMSNIRYPNNMAMPIPHALDMEEAEAMGVEFLEKWLGVKTVEEARKLPADFIEQKYMESRMRFAPAKGDSFVPERPTVSIIEDNLNDVDIMVGNTGEEFMVTPSKPAEKWILDGFGPYGKDYLRLVRTIAGSDDPDAIYRATDFSIFALTARLMAEVFAKTGRNAYYYTFDPYIPGDGAGSFHSCELWFQFENLMKCWRPFDGHHFDLSRRMCNYWSNFAKTGDPNGKDADGTDMPRWEKYTMENPHGIMLCDEIEMEKETPKKTRFLLDINMAQLQFPDK